MFQLALCAGKLDKPEDLVPKHSFSVGRQASSDPRDEDAPPRPTEGKIRIKCMGRNFYCQVK
jgi:hypothetical protein